MISTQVDGVFDVYVIGGGINGLGIAVDAAGRGLKAGICEQGDLAGATSSASSKLIHGGLRYLEQFEFRLVREALAEREVLLNMAPHIAFPMRFCLPHRVHLRPAWMIRLGLFIYDRLSPLVSLKASKRIYFGADSVLGDGFIQGFEYSDVWVDDARLVVLNAMKLKRLSGEVRTRTRCTGAQRGNGLWKISLRDEITGIESVVTSKTLVNATGPWAQNFLEDVLQQPASKKIRLVKGSHIVVPRIHDENRAYILQNADQRVVFVMPWLDKYSLIGTTDVEYLGDPSDAKCSREEKDYLCQIVNEHFKRQISISDIVWDYSGVRPLCEDQSDSPQTTSRDYTMELEDAKGAAPLLSIFGGKLTTYRKLAEAALKKLCPYFDISDSAWTENSKLPGSEEFTGIHSFAVELQTAYPWLPERLAKRFSGSYGTLSYQLLGKAGSIEALGESFGGDLYAAEVDYLILNEWAVCAEDILWRRTKLGLEMKQEGVTHLSNYIRQHLPELLPARFDHGVNITEKNS